MGTGSWEFNIQKSGYTTSSSVGYRLFNLFGTRMSGINASIRNEIPKFATINSATAIVNIKGSGAANADWSLLDENLDPITTLWSQSSAITTSYKEFTRDALQYIESNNADAGLAKSIYCLSFRAKSTSSIFGRTYTLNAYKSTMTFTYPTITVNGNVNNANYGEVVSSTHPLNTPIDIGAKGVWGTQTCVIEAKPKAGYKFKQWSDGNTSIKREVILSEDVLTGHSTTLTYTAQFEATTNVTYDSIFNFKKWKDNGIAASNGTISNITEAGFTLTSNDGVSEGTASSPFFTVEYGKSYKVDIDTVGDDWDVYIFFCDASGTWIDFADSTNRFSSNNGGVASRIFTAPNKSEVVKAQIRVDANGINNAVSFSNFRIYPADYTYMSTTVPAEERSDSSIWSMPTPVRKGHTFLGWNTKPDGSGTTYTSSSSFPTNDLVLFSQWVINQYIISFKDIDGTVIQSRQLEYGNPVGGLPSVSRAGYSFAGWIPCEPAIKTDNTVLDSYQYNGSSSFYALHPRYKYTDKFALHVDAYMSNWMNIGNNNSGAQIISCTEGGGWGLGYMANTSGHGAEIHTGAYTGIDLGFGAAGIFSNNTWYSFDVVFSHGTFNVYVDGVNKGTQTTQTTSIHYNTDNTIFVGAEAASNTITPGGNYFDGFISNVFIANQGTRLQIATANSTVEQDTDYYPVWRLITTRTVTVAASPSAGGIVSGGGVVEHGNTATLTATPSIGYRFVQWSDGNTSNPRTVTVSEDVTYTADFEMLTYSILAVASPAEGGSVIGSGTYSYGSTVTLTATPNNGYKFVQWLDGVTDTTRSFKAYASASYTAVFERDVVSNLFKGTVRQEAYRGTTKQDVYVGIKKIT